MRPRSKRILRRSLWILGFGVLCLPILDDPPLQTGAYLQDVTTDAATIAKIAVTGSWLGCSLKNVDGSLVESLSATGRRRHAFRFEGLAPDTVYDYVIRSRDGPCDGGRFRTAPADDRTRVRFAVLGDSGKQPWWVWLQTAPILHLPAAWGWFPPASAVAGIGAAVAADDPAFLMHLGDIVYPRGQHCHYGPGFFRPFEAVLRKAPFYGVLGNHDVMESGGLQTLANFHWPRNEVTGDSRCYSFAWGAVRLICIDCNDMFFGPVQADHPSLLYLGRELRRCSEPWTIVISHFPMRSASNQRDRGDLLKRLRPLLDEHAVSLYLSGHDHCYQRFEHVREGGKRTTPLVVSGGGGKNLYEVLPVKGAVKLESAYHWCRVEVDGARLRLRAIALGGRLIDELELDLHADDRLDRVRRDNPARAARINALK